MFMLARVKHSMAILLAILIRVTPFIFTENMASGILLNIQSLVDGKPDMRLLPGLRMI